MHAGKKIHAAFLNRIIVLSGFLAIIAGALSINIFGNSLRVWGIVVFCGLFLFGCNILIIGIIIEKYPWLGPLIFLSPNSILLSREYSRALREGEIFNEDEKTINNAKVKWRPRIATSGAIINFLVGYTYVGPKLIEQISSSGYQVNISITLLANAILMSIVGGVAGWYIGETVDQWKYLK